MKTINMKKSVQNKKKQGKQWKTMKKKGKAKEKQGKARTSKDKLGKLIKHIEKFRNKFGNQIDVFAVDKNISSRLEPYLCLLFKKWTTCIELIWKTIINGTIVAMVHHANVFVGKTNLFAMETILIFKMNSVTKCINNLFRILSICFRSASNLTMFVFPSGAFRDFLNKNTSWCILLVQKTCLETWIKMMQKSNYYYSCFSLGKCSS